MTWVAAEEVHFRVSNGGQVDFLLTERGYAAGVRGLSDPSFLLQATAPAAACAALTLWPPSSGKLLLIPIAGQNVGAVAGIALAGGAPLLGPGPLPGSLIVIGERANISRQIKSPDIIVTAAPPAGCGMIGSSS